MDWSPTIAPARGKHAYSTQRAKSHARKYSKSSSDVRESRRKRSCELHQETLNKHVRQTPHIWERARLERELATARNTHLEARQIHWKNKQIVHEELLVSVDKNRVQEMIGQQHQVMTLFSDFTFSIVNPPNLPHGRNRITRLYQECYIETDKLIELIKKDSAGIIPFDNHHAFYRKDELISSLRCRLDYLQHCIFEIQNNRTFVKKSDLHECQLSRLPEKEFYSIEDFENFSPINKQFIFGSSNVYIFFCNKYCLEKRNINQLQEEIKKLPEYITIISTSGHDHYIPGTKVPPIPDFHANSKIFIPTSALLLKNGYALYERVHEYFTTQNKDHRIYYVKDDPEGDSQVKAKRIIRSLTHGFDSYYNLVPRCFKANFSHASVNQVRLKECVVSRGIENVVGFNLDKQHSNYNIAYQQYLAASFQGNRQEAEGLGNYLASLSSVFENKGKLSIPFLALLDILLFSSDSHHGQYVLTDTGNHFYEFVMIEFTRYLPYFETLDQNNKVLCIFRSAFLFNPHVLSPMPESLIRLIDSWDPERIEKELSSLQGDPEQFEEHLFSYIINADDNLEEAEYEIGRQCYPKLHPRSFDLLIQRVTNAKKYVQSCQEKRTSPTVYGLFEYLYPNLATIMNVFKRIEPHASQVLGFHLDRGTLRSIESILKLARKSSLTTPDEIKAMDEAYVQLKDKASPSIEFKQFFSRI